MGAVREGIIGKLDGDSRRCLPPFPEQYCQVGRHLMDQRQTSLNVVPV